MSTAHLTPAAVVAALRAVQSGTEFENVRKRLAPGEEAFGMRMRDLFDVARAHAAALVPQVDRLLDHPAYEPRMAAMWILDFKARRRLDDDPPPWCGRPRRRRQPAPPHRRRPLAMTRSTDGNRGGRDAPDTSTSTSAPPSSAPISV